MPVPALQRFEEFFRATSDCQFYVKKGDDDQFRYVHVNPAALSVAGNVREQEIVGLTPREALGDEYGTTVEQNIRTAYDSGQTHHFRGSLGGARDAPIYDACYCLLRDDAGNIAGILGSARDVSEISRLNERLLHGEKLKALGAIAGTVIHDFNNILSSFQALLHLLDSKEVSEDRRAFVFEQGRTTLENGKTLTERLSMFARRERIRAVPHDVRKLLSRCLPILERVLGRQVQLSIACEVDLWKACCDRAEFEIALVNLATNARDAMKPDGIVTITAKNGVRSESDPETFPAAFVEVTFRDNGSGMDQETASKAADPFFTTKPEGKGTGLGLSAVARFVDDLGGALRVESELGVGSSISLLLPKEQPSGPLKSAEVALTG